MDVLQIASLFNIKSKPVSYSECEIGHINSTYFVTCDDGAKYVAQKINTDIFKDPDKMMDNIFAVSSHIKKYLEETGGDCSRGYMHFHTLSDGKKCYHAPDGYVWRLCDAVANVKTLDFCDSPEVFKKVGAAFGDFQKKLTTFDASILTETIPFFHNTAKRYENFIKSLEKNASGRAASAAAETDFVKSRAEMCSSIVDRISDGRLPLRVTHNDTKLNNILLDEKTLEPVCVIDLDTVMPGSVLYDFGDAIRSGAALRPEDSDEYAECGVSIEMFSAFAEGFIGALDGSISKEEIMLLPLGAKVITFETGMRFLTDYLDGDIYFRTLYPEHNLVRARNQFAMVADIESKTDELCEIVAKFCR